jgi:carbon storage regulator
VLIVTRRIGESIKIGNDIEVVVLPRHHGQTRLGITAPQNMKIIRVDDDYRNRVDNDK